VSSLSWTHGQIHASGDPASLFEIDTQRPADPSDDLVAWFTRAGLVISAKPCRSDNKDQCTLRIDRTIQLKLPASWSLMASSYPPENLSVDTRNGSLLGWSATLFVKRLGSAAALVGDNPEASRRATAIKAMQIVLVAAMVSATGGYLGDVDRTTWASDLVRAAENAVTDLSRAELVLFPLLLVGVAATRMVAVSDRASVDQETAVTGRRTLTCLMFAIAVTPPATSVVSLVAWPGWLLTWWILARLTKRTPSLPPADTDPGTLLDRALVHTAARRALDESDATPADHSEASAQRERRQALQNAPAGDAASIFWRGAPTRTGLKTRRLEPA
jgi:hypothetical protein